MQYLNIGTIRFILSIFTNLFPTEEVIETAEGIIGIPGEIEVREFPVEKTPAQRLFRRIRTAKPLWIMRDLLDTYDEAPEFLDEASKNTFNQVRELTRYLRVRANQVRKRVGLPLIRYTEGYITHWMDSVAKQVVKKDLPVHYGYLYYLMRGLPKTVKNPTQMQRTIRGKMENYFSKDLGKLLRIMTTYDLRDIYITEPYMAAWDE
ncbi:unnamed protein product, partial [marine sediment metagenome]